MRYSKWAALAALLCVGWSLLLVPARRARAPVVRQGAESFKRPLCGRDDDGQVVVPDHWDSFMVPARAGSYLDPAFGCKVVRLTDSSLDGAAEHHYYSTLTPLSADDSKLLVNDEHGDWQVITIDGGVVVAKKSMPLTNGGTLLWDAGDGNSFYFARGNALLKGTIAGAAVKTAMVHQFSEYKVVMLPDKTDLSIDGQSFAMWGGTAANGEGPLDIFTFNLTSGLKRAPYTTRCVQDPSHVQGPCVHGITQTADDNVIIGFANDGSCDECGNRLWDGERLRKIQDATNHIDTGSDLEGRSILIGMGNSRTLAGETNGCPSGWGLDVRQLADMNQAACLLDHQPAWHVSYRGNAAQPWAAISFFDERKSGPERFERASGYQTASPDNWKLYEDEILLARIDGSAVVRLGHARSRSAEGFWAQPRAAISRDGKYVIFDSNMAYAKSGCPAKLDDCSDVYAIKVN